VPGRTRRRPRDDQEVEALIMVDGADRQTKCLADATTDAIPRHRAPDRSRRRDRDARLGQSIRSRAKREHAMLELRALAPHERDLRASPQTRGAHNVAALDDGESLATTRATRGEDTAAAGRLHPGAKSMYARATTGLWLIRALHDRVPSPLGNRANR